MHSTTCVYAEASPFISCRLMEKSASQVLLVTQVFTSNIHITQLRYDTIAACSPFMSRIFGLSNADMKGAAGNVYS